MLRAMSSVRESEWRNLRAVLWDRAFRERGVASAFALVQQAAKRHRHAEAVKAEDAAYELHDAEYRRLCAVNRIELGEAARARPLRRRG
jgi:hypothetical protein